MSQSSSQASLVQDQASLQLLGARLSPGKQTCPAPALPEDNEANDEAVIQQIERTVKTAETVLTSNSKRRIALVAVSIAGSALDQAASSDSSADAAGTSNASEEASKHLDTILQARDCNEPQALSFSGYLRKVEQLPENIRRIQEGEVIQAFQGSVDDWRLINLAASASTEVYKDLREVAASWKMEPSELSNLKSATISVAEFEGRRTLVVSVRGSTAARRDWMVNANGRPMASRKLLDGSTTWHRGFLAVAEAMQKTIASEIVNLKQSGEPAAGTQELLFTGHSAGGAVAQLFYAMCASPEHNLSGILAGFSKVHCITFGCPPVSTRTITRADSGVFQGGLFLNIINEGDPVPLCQEDYIKSLLDIYVKDPEELVAEGFRVPAAKYRVSGQCIVLQDSDPDDTDAVGWKAVVVDGTQMESKLFGNPFLHQMKYYNAVITALAADVR